MNRILLLMALVCVGGAAQVRFEDILKGPGENWLTYSGKLQRLEVRARAAGYAAKRGLACPKVDLPRPRRARHADDADRV